jgi:hypothetical protein
MNRQMKGREGTVMRGRDDEKGRAGGRMNR